MAAAATNSSEIEYEFNALPFRKFKDGRIERFSGEEFVPASDPDPSTGVSSKDVTIAAGVTARLYLPSARKAKQLDGTEEKIPLLVYYHGGGFIVETPFSPLYHPYVSTLVSKADIVAVSVHYRRPTEHPLPTAYEDSWTALEWVASHSTGHGPDAWLNEHADFGRVFMAGDSAGANISYNLAMRIGVEGGPPGLEGVEGIALVHPWFWGEEKLPSELAVVDPYVVDHSDRLWPLVCPSAEKRNDDPRINPGAEGAPELGLLACRRVLVFVAEKDLLRERGLLYAKKLRESGWRGKVEVDETEGETHVFHILSPGSVKAEKMMQRFVAFLHGK